MNAESNAAKLAKQADRFDETRLSLELISVAPGALCALDGQQSAADGIGSIGPAMRCLLICLNRLLFSLPL